MKTKNILNTSFAIIVVILLFSCEKIEDSYAKYLESEKIYSPKVTNLIAKQALKEVTLIWENPAGNIAKKIFIDYQDSTITTETMIDSITITGLEIKGYEISVYTLDAFDNLSVPSMVIAFPNGEDNGNGSE